MSEEQKAISFENAIKLVRSIKQLSDEDGAKVIQELVETAQEKIVDFIREEKRKSKKVL